MFLMFRSIPILILGLKNSGKTDIAFRLLNKKRSDYFTTNGCRTFATKIEKKFIKLTELGGEEFYDIWKYYFLDVSKILMLIDGIFLITRRKHHKTDLINIKQRQQLRRINHSLLCRCLV
jgi:GTPase SAR1 family protein